MLDSPEFTQVLRASTEGSVSARSLWKDGSAIVTSTSTSIWASDTETIHETQRPSYSVPTALNMPQRRSLTAGIKGLMMSPGLKDRLANDLLHACQHRNSLRVETLINQNAPLNGSRHGPTPLIVAIKTRQYSVVKLLVENGVDLNKPQGFPASVSSPAESPSPLFVAIQEGHEPIVKILLQSGANMKKSYKGISPLITAVINSQDLIAEVLIEHGAYVKEEPNDDNPLNIAVKMGNERITRFLIQHGAQIMTISSLRCPILFYAVESGNPRVLQALLENGADHEIHTPNQHGKLPLIVAIEKNLPELVRVLVEYGAEINITEEVLTKLARFDKDVSGLVLHSDSRLQLPADAVMIAIEHGSIGLAKLFLDHGSPINGIQREGFTPLCYALVCHRKDDGDEMINLLLSHGADIGEICPEFELWKILQWFVNPDPSVQKQRKSSGWKDLCDSCAFGTGKLESRMVQLNCTAQNVLPLHLAAIYRCRAGPLRTLISKGADILAVYSLTKIIGLFVLQELVTQQISAVHGAANVEHINLLVKSGAQVDVLDSNKQTPLAWALASTNKAKVRALLKYGCDIQRVSANHSAIGLWGNYLLDNKKRKIILEILDLLLKAGADPCSPYAGLEEDRKIIIEDYYIEMSPGPKDHGFFDECMQAIDMACQIPASTRRAKFLQSLKN